MSGNQVIGAYIGYQIGKLFISFLILIQKVIFNLIYFTPAIVIIYFSGLLNVSMDFVAKNMSEFLIEHFLPVVLILTVVSCMTYILVMYLKGIEFARFYVRRKISIIYYVFTFFAFTSCATIYLFFIMMPLVEHTQFYPYKFLIYPVLVGGGIWGTYKEQFSVEAYKNHFSNSNIFKRGFLKETKKYNEIVVTGNYNILFEDNELYEMRKKINIIMGVSLTILIGLGASIC